MLWYHKISGFIRIYSSSDEVTLSNNDSDTRAIRNLHGWNAGRASDSIEG